MSTPCKFERSILSYDEHGIILRSHHQRMPLLGMVRIVVIARSDAEACALAAPAYARWFETFTFLPRTRDLPAPPNLPKSFEQAVDDGFCLVGSPSVGGTQRLPRLIGRDVARHVLVQLRRTRPDG